MRTQVLLEVENSIWLAGLGYGWAPQGVLGLPHFPTAPSSALLDFLSPGPPRILVLLFWNEALMSHRERSDFATVGHQVQGQNPDGDSHLLALARHSPNSR